MKPLRDVRVSASAGRVLVGFGECRDGVFDVELTMGPDDARSFAAALVVGASAAEAGDGGCGECDACRRLAEVEHAAH